MARDPLQAYGQRILHTPTAGQLGVGWVVTVGNIAAPMAGSTTPGRSGEELKTIARSWRAMTPILGTPVANDKRETVGEVDDLIIAPDRAISSAIMGVGGWLGPRRTSGSGPRQPVQAYRGEDRAAGRDGRRPAGHAVTPCLSRARLTVDLLAWSDWLAAAGITHVAMESTGEYWKPLYNILEGDFTVFLVNAAHVKQVPGGQNR